MGREKLKQENGCKYIKALDEAMMADDFHKECPWSCPRKIWTYIEGLEDPRILLRNLVVMRGKKLRQENLSKVLKDLELQDLELLHELLSTEAKEKEEKYQKLFYLFGLVVELKKEQRRKKEERGNVKPTKGVNKEQPA